MILPVPSAVIESRYRRRITRELVLNRRTACAYACRKLNPACDSLPKCTSKVTAATHPSEKHASSFWKADGKASLASSRKSLCRDHEAIITSHLEAGLGAERIHRELRADWLDPDINPKFEAFCRHYGTSVMPCHPHKPQHKGKVERGNRHVKNSLIAASAIAHNLTVATRNTRDF